MESASIPVIYRAYGYTRGTGIAYCSTQIMILAVAAYDFIAEALGPILWNLSVIFPYGESALVPVAGRLLNLFASVRERSSTLSIGNESGPITVFDKDYEGYP